MPFRSLASLLALFWLQSAFGASTSPTTIAVGFPEGLPGYEMLPNGQLQIDVPSKKKITECIENNMHAKFVWEAYPTKRVIQLLIDKKVDLIFPMGFTQERAATMIQSQYTWENADYFLSSRPIDLGDKNIRMAARLGSPQHMDYAAEGYRHITTTYTYEELVKLLAGGMVDVVIIPQSVYEDQKGDWPQSTIVTAGKQRNTGFYLNKDDPKGLREQLNKSIERCRGKTNGK